MCYHSSHPGSSTLKKNYPQKKVLYQAPEIFHVNGFARPFLPALLNNNTDAIVPARWKLLPYWIKNEEDAKKSANTLNAVGEKIFETSSYKSYILKNRGLLYVNGFFEPHASDGKKNDEAFYIFKSQHEIFTLGIVYADWTDQETGETYPTFSILTTPANPLLKKIHNTAKRMPLIIPPSKHDEWLHTKSKIEIEPLIVPYQGELFSHKVMRAVLSPKGMDTNIPEVQDKIGKLEDS
uniref:Abasic site processing protein HMCES n=1 Tax=Parastrongyloides trichosuri TaxID=131310 RepID=A0A0N4ZVS4_PARTI